MLPTGDVPTAHSTIQGCSLVPRSTPDSTKQTRQVAPAVCALRSHALSERGPACHTTTRRGGSSIPPCTNLVRLYCATGTHRSACRGELHVVLDCASTNKLSAAASVGTTWSQAAQSPLCLCLRPTNKVSAAAPVGTTWSPGTGHRFASAYIQQHAW
jgi:hypothetical protein